MSLCHKKSQFPISIPLAGWQETLGLLPAGWQETKKSPASRLAGDTSFNLSGDTTMRIHRHYGAGSDQSSLGLHIIIAIPIAPSINALPILIFCK